MKTFILLRSILETDLTCETLLVTKVRPPPFPYTRSFKGPSGIFEKSKTCRFDHRRIQLERLHSTGLIIKTDCEQSCVAPFTPLPHLTLGNVKSTSGSPLKPHSVLADPSAGT